MMIHETFDERFGSFSICAQRAVAIFILIVTLAARETMIERIEPPKPGASPYSGAVVAGPFVFVSGQVGNDAKTGTTPPGFKAQTQNALANIQAKLSKAGCSLKDVVKATVFLSDIRGFEEMNEAYRAAFAPDFPARSTIEAHLARPEFFVEIEVIAFHPREHRAPS
jgi:2-iminobutanoate/2-iminopropanoate deaminase